MAVNITKYNEITTLLAKENVDLVAVSKIQPNQSIQQLYNAGQRDFGENYVQELVAKAADLPQDTRWHFIGHLQTNKVKMIAPFVHLIQGVDSEKLLKEIDKQAAKANRSIACLLQMHIATEETKFGMDETELAAIQPEKYPHVKLEGLMGMASFSSNETLVRSEFKQLKTLANKYSHLFTNQPATLSMGMSGDYEMAIEEGSNMVRIGSLLFGARL